MPRPFSIPVLTRKRRIRVHPVSGVDQSNLLPVLKQPQNASVDMAPTLNVKLALLNIRSLSNKSFLINDLIYTHKLDFMLLTETWLEQANSFTTLIESAPPIFFFNLHVDNPENTYANEFLTLIDTFSLTQHVQGPTHSHGHTLDLVITKGLNVSTTVMDLAISDHFCVFFDVCMSPHIQNRSMSVRRRVINNGTGLLFEQALSHTTSQPSEAI